VPAHFSSVIPRSVFRSAFGSLGSAFAAGPMLAWLRSHSCSSPMHVSTQRPTYHQMTLAVPAPASFAIQPLLVGSEIPCAGIRVALLVPDRALIWTSGGRSRRRRQWPGRTIGGPVIHLISTRSCARGFSSALSSLEELLFGAEGSVGVR
jgi:hypothetical protein